MCSSEVRLPLHRCEILPPRSRRTRRSSSPSWTASCWDTSTTSLLMRKRLEKLPERDERGRLHDSELGRRWLFRQILSVGSMHLIGDETTKLQCMYGAQHTEKKTKKQTNSKNIKPSGLVGLMVLNRSSWCFRPGCLDTQHTNDNALACLFRKSSHQSSPNVRQECWLVLPINWGVIRFNNLAVFLHLLAEKANDSFYSNRRQMMAMASKGSLPMEALDMEPEPSNPYSPARQPAAKQNGHKYKSPRSHSSQSLCYSFNTACSPAAPVRSWQSKDSLGLRPHSYGPKKLCIIEKEVHTTRYLPPQPYFVTNSKTEVTVWAVRS